MTVRFGQIGTKHGHARGKWRALVTNPDVEAVAVWEPDAEKRAAEQAHEQFAGAHWATSADDILGDPSIVAVAIEGLNPESLAMAHAAVDAGKHLWYDKPAGDNWPRFHALVEKTRAKGLYLQMGYMFRYQPGFQFLAELSRSGALGDVFSVRAHMSTWISEPAREVISVHRGGIFYDLAGHMLDQVVWHLGRPTRTQLFARNDTTPGIPHFADNTLGVFEFERALAFVDIAAMEPRPNARRFEVYGTKGSAITEPFDPGDVVRLVLSEPYGAYAAGEHIVKLPTIQRQQMYERELAAFVATVRDGKTPDRTFEHELLVQETLLRATGGLPG
ncbi:MAG: Gfo/Idh/MocA family oxidoreductase [Chloroflexi bacterium]|nr:Gfo/Idh/MocA family oxidoreductase [Chloroflexota bacterium]